MVLVWRKVRAYSNEIDGQLLLFLVLLCNVKLVVKAAALLLLLWRHRALGASLLRKAPRFTLFYPAVAVLGSLSAVLAGRFSEHHYWAAFAGSEASWLACGLLSAGLWAETKAGRNDRIEKTFAAFLLLNALVSFGQLAGIMIETGALNPYRYQGNYQKYFINTGDYIKGISFDTSTTNAVLCATGILLFAQKGRWGPVAACLATLLLAASNLVNILVLAGLIFLLFFRSRRPQKSVLLLCFLPFVVFWARISPQNSTYMEKALGWASTTASAATPSAPSQPLTEEERREAYARHWIDSIGSLHIPRPLTVNSVERPALPTDNIHSAAFQHRDDSGARQQQWAQTAAQLSVRPAARLGGKPGKIVALRQTVDWLRQHPYRIYTGTGPAAFSSKMAFKATGMHIAGSYPASLVYVNPEFRTQHLALFLSYFAASEQMHSVLHSPNSVYDQLLGEYGLCGLLLIGGYFLLFWLRRRQLKHTLPLLALLALLLGTDYWMEQLSIVPLFELLFFLELNKTPADA